MRTLEIWPRPSAAPASDELWRTSERMVLYMTTRASYALERELTVDYGPSYTRDYASGRHRPSCRPLSLLPAEPNDADVAATCSLLTRMQRVAKRQV